MKRYEVESGAGKYKVFLFATVTADGIMAVLTGGEKPHLGAVVLSIPRTSLAGCRGLSCTSSVIPLIGHMDDQAAKPLAEMLARGTGHPVSVSAGIHVNNADIEDIEKLKENCMDCGRRLLDLIKDK